MIAIHTAWIEIWNKLFHTLPNQIRDRKNLTNNNAKNSSKSANEIMPPNDLKHVNHFSQFLHCRCPKSRQWKVSFSKFLLFI